MPRPWFVQQPARNGLDNACERILRGFASLVVVRIGLAG